MASSTGERTARKASPGQNIYKFCQSVSKRWAISFFLEFIATAYLVLWDPIILGVYGDRLGLASGDGKGLSVWVIVVAIVAVTIHAINIFSAKYVQRFGDERNIIDTEKRRLELYQEINNSLTKVNEKKAEDLAELLSRPSTGGAASDRANTYFKLILKQIRSLVAYALEVKVDNKKEYEIPLGDILVTITYRSKRLKDADWVWAWPEVKNQQFDCGFLMDKSEADGRQSTIMKCIDEKKPIFYNSKTKAYQDLSYKSIPSHDNDYTEKGEHVIGGSIFCYPIISQNMVVAVVNLSTRMFRFAKDSGDEAAAEDWLKKIAKCYEGIIETELNYIYLSHILEHIV
jgi:hypothetical protein